MKRKPIRKRMCVKCGAYPPVYRYHGGPAKRDRHHDYCQKCWRAAINSVRRVER